MRYSRENIFAQCTLCENIYTSILYYITNIRGELQLAIMATLRGSYIVDIVSHARLLRRHWSVSVASEDTTVKFALRNLLRLRYNMVRYEAERN